MNLLDNLALGLLTMMQQHHLLLLVVGCLLGVVAAAMPRVGMLSAIALALPASLVLETTAALMLLVGIYCGASGGAARAGGTPRNWLVPAGGGVALSSAEGQWSTQQMLRIVTSSQPLLMLIASMIGALAIVVFSPWLVELTFHFGPAEYFSMMALGLLAVVVLAAGSLIKSLAMLVFGLLLAQIESDPSTGSARFDLGFVPFDIGISFIPMALGLIVVGRIVSDLVAPAERAVPAQQSLPASQPVRSQLQQHGIETARGSAIGALFGAIPGGGILIGAFVALGVERRLRAGSASAATPTLSRAPSAALLAGARSSFIPLLALGVPTNVALALMAGLMFQRKLLVGPQMMTGQVELFWGLVLAIAISGVVLFLLGRPLALLASRLESVRYAVLYPVIGAFCCLAAYSLPGGLFDVLQMGLFGALGHLLFKLGCPLAPLLMGFVLGPSLEASMRHALELSGGDWSLLLTRPISAGLLLAAALLVSALLLPSVRPRRAALFELER